METLLIILSSALFGLCCIWALTSRRLAQAVVPGAISAQASFVEPRLIAEASLDALAALGLASTAAVASPTLRLATDDASIPCSVPIAPPPPAARADLHPAINTMACCVHTRGAAVSLRAALNAVTAERMAQAATVPPWVRLFSGAARVLSPQVIVVMLLALLAVGAGTGGGSASGFARAVPMGLVMISTFIGCLIVRRIANREIARVELYETLIYEIVLAAGDAALDALAHAEAERLAAENPAAKPKSRRFKPRTAKQEVMHALHASLAATRYRRIA